MLGVRHAHLLRESCYINGEWRGANDGKFIEIRNPFGGTTVGHVPDCGPMETRDAIDAAQTAFHTWKHQTAKTRAEFMWAWSHLIDQYKEDLGRIMTHEQGKPLSDAIGEIEYANNFIKWFAEEGRRVYGDIIPANRNDQRILVMKEPVGVVGAITPWNFPAAMITRKIAPALAAGCTVVVKPAEETPLTALALAVLAEQAGFPPGVINMVTGNPQMIGLEMTSNPTVQKISFTGSTEVGRLLMKQCASTVKKITLELGGNAPFIVFDDADLSEAVRGVVASKFRNMGQTCVCANRILIHDRIYTEFTQQLVHAVRQLKVGNGLEQGIQQGPLINEKGLEKVEAHVRDARAKGAQIICGGQKHSLGGLFFQPTVITEAKSNMLLAQEETFGPVAPLFRFHTEEEAILLANETPSGLAAYFYSQNMKQIWRVAESLQYGMVGVNAGIISTEVAPFGGVKQSGFGREGSKYGIEPYLNLKYVCMQL